MASIFHLTQPYTISGLQRVRLRHAQPEATLERSRRSRVGRHRRRVRADRERVRVRKPRQDSQDFRRRSGDDQLMLILCMHSDLKSLPER